MSGSLTQGPVHVRLFGRISPGTRTDVQLSTPEDSLIRDMKTEMGFLPFNTSNFICRDTNSDTQEPLPHKLKTDLERRFRTAVDRMIAAEARQNDGLPSSLSSYAGALSRTSSALIPAKSENDQASPEDGESFLKLCLISFTHQIQTSGYPLLATLLSIFLENSFFPGTRREAQSTGRLKSRNIFLRPIA